ncbi:Embryogenesis-associated protein EMB8 [Apostasia shenzhenica]|uniref:Embryogenesis-associated protein EMB8 n=1 Tax=Apostasia shenzhenica TaxID=1088818 RepID=A0A2I0B8R0_9ASPA|nr:Embryogenesis-associated protein EMB8 [Apostasia shenzhenica]
MASALSPLSPIRQSLPSPWRSRFPFMNLPISSFSSMAADEPHDPSFESLEVIGSRRAMLSRFASLQKPYRPFPIIGWNRHLETIFAAFFRSLPRVRLRRECLRTSDDGAVALDWVSGDDVRLPPHSAVLILLPGLTGGSQDAYVRHLLMRARKKGWRVVVFNSRGCADSPVTTPKFYSASFTTDLCEVVKHVSVCYPNCNMYAVGWSLGANILVRYLAQESYNCPLSGAVSLCNPFNLPIADEDFHKGFNNVYDKALAGSLRRIFKKHALLFEGLQDEYNISMAANARTVREFDEGLTRVSFGFKSVDDYYFNSSSSNSIAHVQTPLLCIQAANDPIAPSRGIPREEIKKNHNCLLIVTPKGGHLGWIGGEEAPFGAPWTDGVVMEFLESLEGEKTRSISSTREITVVQVKYTNLFF